MKLSTIKQDVSILFLSVILLICLGLIFIYSSSSVYALEHCGSAHYFVKKQVIGALIGFFALICTVQVPFSTLQYASPWLFIASLIFTACTLIPSIGMQIHGSSRWISYAGFSLQPSEFLKISFLLYIAYFLAKRTGRSPSFLHNYLPLLFIIGLTSSLLLLQPDFGLTVTLAATAWLVAFIAYFQTAYLYSTIFAALPLLGILIYIKPYRIKRILTFLNPWSDPQGAGFQIIQSLIAIGSGNLFGVGIAQSKQKFFYLPMLHTDFIFSIIAEELGFIGCFFIITLWITILYCGLRIAHTLQNPFARYIVAGCTIQLNLQALINLAVATGLAPTKGIGLPFVSYGNSALIAHLIMIGLIINVTRNSK